VLKLNGGLGTSMGLDKAKSLLVVKGNNTFLDLTAKQVITMRKKFKLGVKFMLMNSFNTSVDTLTFMSKYSSIAEDAGLELMQNKVPKVDKKTLGPVSWSINKHLEWCPPRSRGFVHGSVWFREIRRVACPRNQIHVCIKFR